MREFKDKYDKNGFQQLVAAWSRLEWHMYPMTVKKLALHRPFVVPLGKTYAPHFDEECELNKISVGHFLSRCEGFVYKGFVLRRGKNNTGPATWLLEPTTLPDDTEYGPTSLTEREVVAALMGAWGELPESREGLTAREGVKRSYIFIKMFEFLDKYTTKRHRVYDLERWLSIAASYPFGVGGRKMIMSAGVVTSERFKRDIRFKGQRKRRKDSYSIKMKSIYVKKFRIM